MFISRAILNTLQPLKLLIIGRVYIWHGTEYGISVFGRAYADPYVSSTVAGTFKRKESSFILEEGKNGDFVVGEGNNREYWSYIGIEWYKFSQE